MWRKIQTVFILLGLLLVFGGNKLSIPFLMDAGIACLGLGSIAVGWEAIFTRRIVIGRRRHGVRQSYSGIPAMMQGVQFNFIGFFLIVFAFMLYQNVDTHAVGIEIARHPGVLLVVIGFIILTQAVIVVLGSDEFKAPTRNNILIDLFLLRLFPGTILVILSLALLGSGLFEIVAPTAFDAMGGKILEMLYGLR